MLVWLSELWPAGLGSSLTELLSVHNHAVWLSKQWAMELAIWMLVLEKKNVQTSDHMHVLDYRAKGERGHCSMAGFMHAMPSIYKARGLRVYHPATFSVKQHNLQPQQEWEL